MKFCPECGNPVEGYKFFPNCGYSISNQEPNNLIQSINQLLHLLPHEAEKQTKSGHLRLIDIIVLIVFMELKKQKALLDWSEEQLKVQRKLHLRLVQWGYP